MEITNEIKAKVFAQYYGAQIIQHPLVITGSIIDTINRSGLEVIKLKLKPLSAITDEDAVSLIKLFSPDATDIYLSKGVIYWTYDFLGEPFEDTTDLSKIGELCFPPCVYQFLQSRGYDLPHFHLNGQTLKEAGLAVYE